MSVLYEFLDVCYAQCKQAERIAVMSGSARMLFEYSALRLAKIGCAGKKDPEKWQGLFDKILEDTKRIYPDHQLMGETVRLKWNFHPALAWLAARTGDKDLVAALDQAAGEICNDFHRNEDGLFDNPVYPGALSTEILAMTVPILAWAGKCTGKRKECIDLSVPYQKSNKTSGDSKINDPIQNSMHHTCMQCQQ